MVFSMGPLAAVERGPRRWKREERDAFIGITCEVLGSGQAGCGLGRKLWWRRQISIVS